MRLILLKTLLDDLSQFGDIVISKIIRPELFHRYCQNVVEMLKLIKPVLENVSDIASDGQQDKVFHDLDVAINDARKLVESWHHLTSKIYFVLKIESVAGKLRMSVLESYRVLQFLSDNHTSVVEDFIEKIQNMQFDVISDVIKEALSDISMKKEPRAECVKKISESLSLLTNQDLLMEAVALDKINSKQGEVEDVENMIALIIYTHDCYVRLKQVQSINCVPIPADFCCPLSLEIMSDPVIVASGQTYERAFIRKWLDQGLTVCPKTRQTLSHTNLIPNYTVKALIANWCESNNIKLPDPVKSANLNQPSSFLDQSGFSPSDLGTPLPGHPSGVSHRSRSPEVNRSTETSQRGKISYHSSQASAHSSPINGSDVDFSRISSETSSRDIEGSSEQVFDQLQGTASHAFVIDGQTQDHSRSNSASAAISDYEYVQASGDGNSVLRGTSEPASYSSDGLGELARDVPVSTSTRRETDFPVRLNDSRGRMQSLWSRPSDRFGPRVVSSSLESRPDHSGVETQVREHVEQLKSDMVEEQRTAASELRLLARHNMENRIVIAKCGAINLLVGLLRSTDLQVQENSVTALLNLSINDINKENIANADAIEPLIHVLETGSPEAKENSAATLFSLSVIEANKARIGRSGAIGPLVNLLGNGSPRGKKDAATALFNLSIFHENKARIVQAGAVKYLVELMDPAAGMVDKAVAVLANLATISEGRTDIGREGGIPVLVEVVELGSDGGKENAAAALLQLCINSSRFCSQVLQEGVVPPLVALSQSGTPRAREKAQALLSYFRNQRHGNARP